MNTKPTTRQKIAAWLRAQTQSRTIAETATGVDCSRQSVRSYLNGLEAERRVGISTASWPYRYTLLPPAPPDISRYYLTDPASRNGPQSLAEFVAVEHGAIWPGDRVSYENPHLPGKLQLGNAPLTVTALVDLGSGPPQAILNDGEYEVSAGNLRRLTLEQQLIQDNATSASTR